VGREEIRRFIYFKIERKYMSGKEYAEPKLVPVYKEPVSKPIEITTRDRTTHIEDLSKQFSAGKINVNDFMLAMTTGKHEQSARYQALIKAQEQGFVSEIHLAKNSDGTYEFKGMLTREGLAKQNTLRKGERSIESTGEMGDVYFAESPRKKHLNEAVTLGNPPVDKVEEEIVEEPKPRKKELSDVDSVLIDNKITMDGRKIPFSIAGAMERIGFAFSETYKVSETTFESTGGKHFSLTENNLFAAGKVYDGSQTL
jgi:hypothetical protein